MPGSGRVRLRPLHAALFAAGISCAMPAPAHAQNLLESLFGALGGRAANAAAPRSAPAADPNAWDFIDRAESSSYAPRGQQTSYCVRLCDGRYFPLPRRAGAVNMSDAQICSAMCPAAKTAVFNGTAIERTVGESGKAYSSIENAFLYREKTVADCTCTNRGSGGVASLDVKDDPTLRKGDIVVTREGPMVYTGKARGKDREQAFVRAEDYKGLPQSVRNEMTNMRVAQEPAESAFLPADAKPASNSVPVAAATAFTAEPASVVAEAFASFRR